MGNENGDKNLDPKEILRNKAEQVAHVEKGFNYDTSLTEMEALKLIHELEVHQIELEMQNEELMLASKNAALITKKYADLYDFAPSGYFTLSEAGIILENNITGSKILGEHKSKLLNSRFNFFVLDRYKPIFNAFLKNIFTKTTIQICDIELFSFNDYSFFVHLTGLISENKKECFITMIDITNNKLSELAVRESEKKYRELIHNLDAGIVVHAPDTSIIMCNLKATEILGLTKDQLLGKDVMDKIWHFLDENYTVLQTEDYPINQILRDKKPLINLVGNVFRPKKQDTALVLVNGFPVMNSKNEISEVVVSFVDISLRREMENELIRVKDEAIAATEAKSLFLSTISHEISTPLNGIIGFTELLMKTKNTEEQAEYSNIINDSSNALMAIVNDVLDFSKIESGKLELNIVETDILQLIHQVALFFKNQINLKGLEFKLKVDDSVPQFILTDSVRLKQILLNLIGNAIKFTESGAVSLRVKNVYLNDTSFSTLYFSVKDTGIGIHKENQDKIFDSFAQEDTSITRKYGGTGLGLSISKKLLKLMNSDLNLKSYFGKGSDFNFTIVFERPNLNPITTDFSLELEEKNYENLDNAKILIVEDNKINMLLVKKIINQINPNCILFEANNGNEAVKIHANETLDIILMDIQMPEKNGYDSAYEIRNSGLSNQPPIIALTAGILNEDKQKCLDLGMNDYISKPFKKTDLEQMLLKWVKKA